MSGTTRTSLWNSFSGFTRESFYYLEDSIMYIDDYLFSFDSKLLGNFNELHQVRILNNLVLNIINFSQDFENYRTLNVLSEHFRLILRSFKVYRFKLHP